MIPIIRAAQAADADRVAEIHGRAGQWAYGDLLPAAFLAGLSVERRAAYWRRWLSDSGLRRHLWLSTREAHVVGFAAISPSRDTDADTKTGELERCGWHVDGGEKAEELGDRTAREVRYRKALTA